MAQRWAQSVAGSCDEVNVQMWQPKRNLTGTETRMLALCGGVSHCLGWKVASKVSVSVCRQWEARGRRWLRLEMPAGAGLKEAYLSQWCQQHRGPPDQGQGLVQDVTVEVRMWESDIHPHHIPVSGYLPGRKSGSPTEPDSHP